MSQSLFVASRGGDEEHARWAPIGKLSYDATGGYCFVYTQGARKLEGFMPLPGMPNLDDVYESQELFPLFANRLLVRSRPEYEKFLKWGGFDPTNPPDPIMELAVTEGRRMTDLLELFPCPQPDKTRQYTSKFFLHGVRWVSDEGKQRIVNLKSDEVLQLKAEPENQYDSNAVAVYASEIDRSVKVGYIPRYLAQDVIQLDGGCGPDSVNLTVERLNTDAPLQQRVLCRINSCWPDGFNPCATSLFEPIVAPALIV